LKNNLTAINATFVPRLYRDITPKGFVDRSSPFDPSAGTFNCLRLLVNRYPVTDFGTVKDGLEPLTGNSPSKTKYTERTGSARAMSTKGNRTLPMRKVCLQIFPDVLPNVFICVPEVPCEMSHSFIYLLTVEVNLSQQ
jgi:hypothetical protein